MMVPKRRPYDRVAKKDSAAAAAIDVVVSASLSFSDEAPVAAVALPASGSLLWCLEDISS